MTRTTAFLDALTACTTFAARKRLCTEAHLERLGAGSSRIVYALSATRVVKLAKNAKGIAQNEMEGDALLARMYPTLVARTLRRCPDNTWIVQQRATPARKADFPKQFGLSLQELGLYMAQTCFPYNRWLRASDATVARFRTCRRLSDFVECALNFDLHAGDMGRLSTWGMVGKRLVLIDYGLTRSNYNEYYARRRR
jgi:hypothetical protein